MKKLLLMLCINVFSVSLIVSCGGGGGGGGTSGITYTGVTTQATIDENNAVEITLEAYEGVDTASELNILGAVSENSSSVKNPLFVDISTYFQSVIYDIESSAGQNSEYMGAVITESDTITGSCGGSFSYTLTGDDQTGNFNGTLTFNNFCEQEYTASGSMTLSGNINLNTEEFNYFDMTFTNISLTHGQESISLNGSIAFNLQSSPITMTFSFIYKDNLNKTYKYENFAYEYTEGLGFVDMTFSGRFYHHDYGYVDIDTVTALRINGNDFYPSSGTVIVTGDSGTKARLLVIDSSSFIIEADTDGDGSYDNYNSGAILWSNV
ncbi:MAG: hypothetical protein OEM90_21175 [Desulfobacteraceae bacterium]|jgi:hypothetical protein|nr:hypothetical protein [Desulfobacteraceae bacterium]